MLRLEFAPKWSIPYIQPILAAIVVTIAKVKVKTNTRLTQLGHCSYKYYNKKNLVKIEFSYFGLIGGPK